MTSLDILRTSWGLLRDIFGTYWKHFWNIFQTSWEHFFQTSYNIFWTFWGIFRIYLGQCWDISGISMGRLRTSCEHIHAIINFQIQPLSGLFSLAVTFIFKSPQYINISMSFSLTCPRLKSGITKLRLRKDQESCTDERPVCVVDGPTLGPYREYPTTLTFQHLPGEDLFNYGILCNKPQPTFISKKSP